MTKDGAYGHLNQLLHSLVRRRDVRAKLKKLSPHTAESEWSNKRIDIKIDVDTTGKIPAMVHELLHYHMEERLKDLHEDLEETMVQALEEELVRFLQKDKRRMDWWRKTIRGIL